MGNELNYYTYIIILHIYVKDRLSNKILLFIDVRDVQYNFSGQRQENMLNSLFECSTGILLPVERDCA